MNGEIYTVDNYTADCKNKFSEYDMDFFDPICANIHD